MRRAGTVAINTLGCRLNQAETESISRNFLERGYELRGVDKGVDIYVLNTCTVTHVADRRSRHLIRTARRINPSALLIATGCYAQRSPGELAEAGADLVIGNDEKRHLVEVLEERGALEPTRRCGLDEAASTVVGWGGFRTRPLVKIQEGCRSFCSFCIVPWVRGPERSIPPEHVIDEVKSRVAEGYREVVLTGTKIGAYRWNGEGECHGSAEGIGLKHLLSRILAETDVERLRLSSLQPQDLTPSLMEMWSDRRLCHHLHIPLQSGSDGVLRRMGREYSTSDYERAVSLAREAIPGVAITTDVIVGFPGETADEFEESYQFCCKIGFARIHVFPYSLRPGTAASRMSHRVKDVVRKERCQQMAGLARESGRRFRQQFLGEVMGVLWEKEEGGMWSGLTDNYIRVFVESAGTLSNHLLQARLVTEMDEGVRGDLVSLTTTSPHPAGSLTVNNGQHSIGLLDET